MYDIIDLGEYICERKRIDKKQYLQLSEVFENWYFKKLNEVEVDKNLSKPPKNMLKRLALSENEFYEKYINPYKNLSKQDLQTVFRVLAPELLETYIKDDSLPAGCELKLKYDLSSTRKENALSWLLFQVNLLGIFNLSKNLKKILFVPYHQCYYCGKPNFYIRNGEIKKFNLKEILCHKDKCQKSSNPEKHDNCCYAKWVRRRKSLEKALSVVDNLYNDIEIYENEKLSDEQKAILNNKLAKIFIDFCEKQYQENLKINYTIQESDNKAINLLKYSL